MESGENATTSKTVKLFGFMNPGLAFCLIFEVATAVLDDDNDDGCCFMGYIIRQIYITKRLKQYQKQECRRPGNRVSPTGF